MKQLFVKLPLLILLSLGMARIAVAQSASAPRLQTPIVIPAGAPSGQAPSAPATPPEPAPTPQSPRTSTPAPVVVVQPQPVAQGNVHQEGRLQLDTLSVSGQRIDAGIPVTVPVVPMTATAQKRAEMIMRMRQAVERIAADYGNPMFAQVFTNDPIQAQLLRKRVQMLQHMDAINAEIAKLEQQKTDAKQELDATRHEMIALQEQAQALSDRLQKARSALSMSN